MHDRSPATRQQIINAARRHFAHFGFHKVTMNEIAREVGLGKASLYYYVPTKEDLFRQVVMSEQAVFIEELKTIVTMDMSAARRLHTYVESRYAFMNSLLRLNILDVAGSDTMRPMLRKLFTDFVSREITLVTKIMNSGIRQKEFSISSPGKTAETLVHTIQGLRLRFLRNAPLDLEDYRKLKPELLLLARVFVRGLQCQ